MGCFCSGEGRNFLRHFVMACFFLAFSKMLFVIVNQGGKYRPLHLYGNGFQAEVLCD